MKLGYWNNVLHFYNVCHVFFPNKNIVKYSTMFLQTHFTMLFKLANKAKICIIKFRGFAKMSQNWRNSKIEAYFKYHHVTFMILYAHTFLCMQNDVLNSQFFSSKIQFLFQK